MTSFSVLLLIAGWWMIPSVVATTRPLPDSGKVSYCLLPGDQIGLLCIKNDRTIDSAYRIRPNDALFIQFPSLPNYSTDLLVLSDGSVCIPRCDPVKISGMTVKEAKSIIKSAFSEAGWSPDFFIRITRANQESQEVFEWFKQSLSGRDSFYRIRPDGSVSLPYIGDIPAAGKTIAQLTDSINSRYNRYSGLSFSVVLTETAESQIYVFGEVKNPGVFTVKHNVSLLHVISLAGGFTYQAQAINTVVIRTADDTVFVNRIDSRMSMQEGTRIGEPRSALRYLSPGSIVFVPRKKLFKLVDYMKAIQSILAFQGFGLGFQWRFGYQGYY